MFRITGNAVYNEDGQQITAKCPDCGYESSPAECLEHLKKSPHEKCGGCGSQKNRNFYLDGELAKQCSVKAGCGKVLGLDEFPNNKRGIHGKHSECMECANRRSSKYRNTPEGKENRKQFQKEYFEKHKYKASGKFTKLFLPELEWDIGNEYCPWMMDGEPFDIEKAREEGITHIVFISVVRNGKGIVVDDAKYAGHTHIQENKIRTYFGSPTNLKAKEFYSRNKKWIERHVIAVAKGKNEAGQIERDLLAHDDGTGIPRWKKERKDWLNLGPGGSGVCRVIKPSDITPKDKERFEAKVDKNGPQTEYVDTPCHMWTGAKQATGYGQFRFKRGNINPAMFSKILYHGAESGEGKQANHLCNNPPCVNPDHISVGSHKDNMSQMIADGRNADFNGENSYHAFFTYEEVREIRKKYASGKYSKYKLAEKYEVKYGVIVGIVTNTTYKIENDPEYTEGSTNPEFYVETPIPLEKHKGGDHSRAIFTWEQARNIRKDHKSKKYTPGELANKYNTSTNQIKKIVTNKHYKIEDDPKYVPGSTDPRFYVEKAITREELNGENMHNAKLNWEKVRKIRQEYIPNKYGHGLWSLAKKYKVDIMAISQVIKEKTWKIKNDPLYKESLKILIQIMWDISYMNKK